MFEEIQCVAVRCNNTPVDDDHVVVTAAATAGTASKVEVKMPVMKQKSVYFSFEKHIFLLPFAVCSSVTSSLARGISTVVP